MTAPGEFARVERVIVKGDTMPRFQAVVGKFRGDMTLVEEIARIEADKINAAVEKHVEKAVEPYLQTIEAIEKEVAKVYCHITNGRISKVNTKAESVIGESDDITAKLVEEAVKEAMTCRVCGNKDSVCSSNWTREVRRAVEEFRMEVERKLISYGKIALAAEVHHLPLSPAEKQADGVTEDGQK